MCETRWNTFDYMVDSVEKNYDKIKELLIERKSVHCLPPRNILVEVHKFLQLFSEITVRCEANKTATAHLVWISSHKINQHLVIERGDLDLEVIKQMKKAASEYFKKDCFDLSDYNIVAPILYPPMNALNFASESEKNNAYRILRNMMAEIDENDNNENYILDEGSKRKVNGTNSFIQGYVNGSNGDELSRYKQTIVLENDEFDLFEWWYNHQLEFPKLFKIFCKIYSVPASSAASERQFSCAGNVVTNKRNALAPKKAEAIVILHNNLDILELSLTKLNKTT